MKVKSLPQLLVGGAVIFVGVGFLLDALNAWDFSSLIADMWPVLVMAVGLASLLTNPSAPLWPAFIIGAAVLALLRNLDVVDFDVWQVIWPMAIIVFGLSFFFDKLFPGGRPVQSEASDLFVAFSGIDTVNRSTKYQGGRLTALFGGIKLDLREAKLSKDARLDVFTAFGGVEILVPDSWAVNAHGLPLFGGIENKARSKAGAKGPVLNVRGTCLFGGVGIKN